MNLKNKNIQILIGLGVLGALGLYLYNKQKQKKSFVNVTAKKPKPKTYQERCLEQCRRAENVAFCMYNCIKNYEDTLDDSKKAKAKK